MPDPDQPPVEPGEPPARLRLAVGESARIALRGLSGAGYRWRAEVLDGAASAGQHEVIEIGWERGPSPDAVLRPGASVAEIVIVTATAGGEATLRLTHARPWEQGVTPAAQHDIRVSVVG